MTRTDNAAPLPCTLAASVRIADEWALLATVVYADSSSSCPCP